MQAFRADLDKIESVTFSACISSINSFLLSGLIFLLIRSYCYKSFNELKSKSSSVSWCESAQIMSKSIRVYVSLSVCHCHASYCHKIPATVLLEAITAIRYFFSVRRHTICIFPALSLVLVRNNSDYFWHFSELHNKILQEKNGWYFKYYRYKATYILSDITCLKHINTSQWLECYSIQNRSDSTKYNSDSLVRRIWSMKFTRQSRLPENYIHQRISDFSLSRADYFYSTLTWNIYLQ